MDENEWKCQPVVFRGGCLQLIKRPLGSLVKHYLVVEHDSDCVMFSVGQASLPMTLQEAVQQVLQGSCPYEFLEFDPGLMLKQLFPDADPVTFENGALEEMMGLIYVLSGVCGAVGPAAEAMFLMAQNALEKQGYSCLSEEIWGSDCIGARPTERYLGVLQYLKHFAQGETNG